MRCLKNFHLKWTKVTMMRIFLILLCGRTASSYTTLLESNPHFDRLYSENFGNEIIFYGLGLNYTNLTNFNQQAVLSFMICKTIFRMVQDCLSAFAERLDNGTVLCTYTQKAVYELPTFQSDETKAFAFFKDLYANGAVQIREGWSYLTSMGKFYIFTGYQAVSTPNASCNRDYPNRHSLRLQTKKELTEFYGISPQLESALLDLTCINGLMIWGDGTLFSKTETGSSLVAEGTDSCSSSSGLFVVLLKPTTYKLFTSPASLSLFCEVNLFALP